MAENITSQSQGVTLLVCAQKYLPMELQSTQLRPSLPEYWMAMLAKTYNSRPRGKSHCCYPSVFSGVCIDLSQAHYDFLPTGPISRLIGVASMIQNLPFITTLSLLASGPTTAPSYPRLSSQLVRLLFLSQLPFSFLLIVLYTPLLLPIMEQACTSRLVQTVYILMTHLLRPPVVLP